MQFPRFALKGILAASLSLAAALASATPITSLFSTGLTASGTAQAAGGADAHYVVLENGNAPALVRTGLPGTYSPNDASSQWIWQQADGQPVNVTRTFRTTFDLTGFDLTTAVINGLWGTDNTGLDILINGISTGIGLPGSPISNFQTLHAFTISSGFVAGVNTLDFKIQDVGAQAAFRAQLSGEARSLQVVPAPATLALVGLALVALGVTRRRTHT